MKPEREHASPLRVWIVDPEGFSPQYDHALADALAMNGTRVDLRGRPWGERPDRVRYSVDASDRRLSDIKLSAVLPRPALRLLKGADHAAYMYRLARDAETERPDIVHVQWLPIPAIDLLALRSIRSVAPVLLTLHNTSLFHGSPSSGIQALGYRKALSQIDHFIVHTEHGREAAEASGISRGRLTVVPHGAFTHYCELVDDAAVVRPSDERCRLLFAGNIKPYKGLDVLLDAMGQLTQDERGRFELVIAGSASQSVEPLKSLSKSLNIESMLTWKLGHQSERELATLLATSDVVVLPYREIDMSGILLAAVAMGKPVIASRLGGIPEIVRDGENGFLVEPEDSVELAAAIRRFGASVKARNRLAQSMRELVTGRLSWSSIALETMRVYEATRRPPTV